MAPKPTEDTLSFPPQAGGPATPTRREWGGRCEQVAEGAPAGGGCAVPLDVTLSSDLVDEGVIAEGGMSWVHRVFDRKFGRRLAMKVLKPDCSERMRRRFQQETLITAQLDHPAIVPVHCVGSDERGRPSRFTMKMVEGETLAELLDRTGRPLRGDALAEFVRNMVRVCDALAFAHSRGIVHCDLKPDNLMLGRFGEVYVMDWGVALARDGHALTVPEELAPTDSVCGTPEYMPPEQAQGRLDLIDERCDVFALGAVIYEAMTLVPPRSGVSPSEVLLEAAWGSVTPPDEFDEDDPPPAELCDITMKALAPAPGDRYFSAEEMRMALERFLHAGAWFTRRRFAAGSCVIREGDRGDRAYFVEQGRCVVYCGKGADRQVLRELGPGELFGELALFASDVRVASVECVTDAVLLEVSEHAVDRELPEGSWTRRMLDTLGRRFVEYDRERR
ncbi:MAG: cyclic nucleotide-binding domain-containing protein [Myxococcales bacterium]|nr:cyclic nucleotide-binding domain-containing protein [Myxococcales bacterium]